MPEAYLIPSGLIRVVDLLRRQGIAVERPSGPVAVPVEVFMVDSLVRGPLFEGHHPVRVEGRWKEGSTESIASGWYLVRTRQPLGVLAAYLLEPASEDGVATWNFLDSWLAEGRPFPIVRSRRSLAAGHAAP